MAAARKRLAPSWFMAFIWLRQVVLGNVLTNDGESSWRRCFYGVLGERKRQLIPQAEGVQPVAAAQPRRRTGSGMAKEVADFGMGEEKALRAAYAPETSLLPFLRTCWPVRLFN